MKRVKPWGLTVAVAAVLGSFALLYFNYFANGTVDPPHVARQSSGSLSMKRVKAWGLTVTVAAVLGSFTLLWRTLRRVPRRDGHAGRLAGRVSISSRQLRSRHQLRQVPRSRHPTHCFPRAEPGSRGGPAHRQPGQPESIATALFLRPVPCGAGRSENAAAVIPSGRRNLRASHIRESGAEEAVGPRGAGAVPPGKSLF